MVGGGGVMFTNTMPFAEGDKDIQELRINTNDGIAFCV